MLIISRIAVLPLLRLWLLCMRVARHAWCVGVFDGHRGWEAAQYAAEHFQERLLSQTEGSDAGSALRAAFLSLDASFACAQVLHHLGWDSIQALLLIGALGSQLCLQRPHDIQCLSSPEISCREP